MDSSGGEGRGKVPGEPVALDEGFVRRTYRSTILLTLVVVLYLWRYGMGWAVLPVTLGAAVGLGMFFLSDILVRRVFTVGVPNSANTQASDKKFRSHLASRALFALALIKYVLAALLLWALVRAWDIPRLGAFVGGFCLVHVGIVLRALSRVLVAAMNQMDSPNTKHRP